MKFSKSKITSIMVDDISGMDPISITIDDQGHGKGRITFSCESVTYSSFWGSMGTDISSFVIGINDSYLCSNVGGPAYSIIDMEAFKKSLTGMANQAANDDLIDAVEFGECLHCIDLHDEFEAIAKSLPSVFYEAINLDGPWQLNAPMIENPEYKRFEEITAIVRIALKWELDDRAEEERLTLNARLLTRKAGGKM